MSRRRRQLAVRNPDVLLLLPLLARAHCHARILRTKPVDTATFLAHASRVSPQADSVAEQSVKILNAAREEIECTGTLSQKTYASVFPLVEDQRQTQVNSADTEKMPNPVIGDEFAQRLEERKSTFDASANEIQTELVKMISDRLAAFALPGEDLDKILVYESRIRKQLDWALERLTECQKRRKKTPSLLSGRGPSDLHLAGGKRHEPRIEKTAPLLQA